MDSSHPREDISVTAETRRAVKKGGRNRTTRHPNPALYDWNQHRSHLSHTTRIIKSLATWHPLFSVSRPLAQKAERQETENETSRERTLCMVRYLTLGWAPPFSDPAVALSHSEAPSASLDVHRLPLSGVEFRPAPLTPWASPSRPSRPRRWKGTV